ncbi:unnamed protein product [Orchesella dallaii]
MHYKQKHLKEKNFPCDVCEKLFTRAFTLKRHKETKHESIGKICTPSPSMRKPNKFRCFYCHARFSCPRNRLRHMKTNHYLALHKFGLKYKRYRDLKYAKKQKPMQNKKQTRKNRHKKTEWKPLVVEIYSFGCGSRRRLKVTQDLVLPNRKVDKKKYMDIEVHAFPRIDGISQLNKDKKLYMHFQLSPRPQVYKVGRFSGGIAEVVLMLKQRGMGNCSSVDAYMTHIMKDCDPKYVYLPMSFWPDEEKKEPNYEYLPSMDLRNKTVIAPMLLIYNKYAKNEEEEKHAFLAVIDFETKTTRIFDSSPSALRHREPYVSFHVCRVVKCLIKNCLVGYKFVKKEWSKLQYQLRANHQVEATTCCFYVCFYAKNILLGKDSRNFNRIYEKKKPLRRLIKQDFLSTLLQTTQKGRLILAALCK